MLHTVAERERLEKSGAPEERQLLSLGGVDDSSHGFFCSGLHNQEASRLEQTQAVLRKARIGGDHALCGMALGRFRDKQLLGEHTQIARPARRLAALRLASGAHPDHLSVGCFTIPRRLLGGATHVVPAGEIQHLAPPPNPRSEVGNKTPCNPPPTRTAGYGTWFSHKAC